MAVLVNGSATMDERMVLRKADEIFYQYVGSDIYAPITHRIHPDDVRKFTDAINELKSGQLTETYVSVRLKEITDNFSWATIKLSWEPFALDGKPLFHLELSSNAISEQSTTNMQSTTHQYEVLLGLLGGMLLSYSSDTDIFEIFTICNEQKLHSYRGTLAEWENNFLKNHLDPDSIPDFQAFCLNLHDGQKRFKHNILTNAFSKNAAMELCSFQCQTIRDKKNNSYKVLGCITLFGKGKHRMPEADYGLDTSMPILNKKAITEYAKKALLTNDSRVYLAVLDLDNFKTINDTYGHFFGDEVLNTTAEKIKMTLGNTGVVGRIGGDEMMLVLSGVENENELRNLLRAIRTNIEWSYKETRDDLRITCSIGVATFPDHCSSYEELFQLADKMLYIAKKKGKNRYIIYIPEIHDPQLNATQADISDAPAAPITDKTIVMQHLIENYLLRKVVTQKQAMHELISCMALDEILMVYGNMQLTTMWDKDGNTCDLDDSVFLNPEEGFLTSFDNHNCFVCNSVYNLEVTAPNLFNKLRERGMESVICYQMAKHGKMFGYVIYGRKTRRQMWSEFEQTIFAIAGKIFEMYMRDK